MWEDVLLGAMPPGPEAVDVEVVLGAVRGGVERRGLLVRWDGGLLRARLLVPVVGGDRVRRPVLLVQSSHGAWAAAAVRRGMAACVVSAADGDDDTDAFALPTTSRLARRAWALSRVVDALASQRGVDATRVVVAGHSRNGKTALLCGAFDERVAAVCASSSGVLGAVPVRTYADRHGGEGLELLTRWYPDWYAPGLRAYAGREHELPTDAHELVACIAPRPVLLVGGDRDGVEPVEGVLAAAAAAAPAWAAHDARGPEVRVRAGGGHDLGPADIEDLIDWCAGAVGWGDGGAAALGPPATPVASTATPFPRAFFAPPARPLLDPPALRRAIAAATGPEPPRAADARRARRPVVTGDGAPVELFGAGPLVLWCAPGCAPTGWRVAYEDGATVPELLVAAGFTVACHDPVGTGPRQAE